jgi:hypothetical protein
MDGFYERARDGVMSAEPILSPSLHVVPSTADPSVSGRHRGAGARQTVDDAHSFEPTSARGQTAPPAVTHNAFSTVPHSPLAVAAAPMSDAFGGAADVTAAPPDGTGGSGSLSETAVAQPLVQSGAAPSLVVSPPVTEQTTPSLTSHQHVQGLAAEHKISGVDVAGAPNEMSASARVKDQGDLEAALNAAVSDPLAGLATELQQRMSMQLASTYTESLRRRNAELALELARRAQLLEQARALSKLANANHGTTATTEPLSKPPSNTGRDSTAADETDANDKQTSVATAAPVSDTRETATPPASALESTKSASSTVPLLPISTAPNEDMQSHHKRADRVLAEAMKALSSVTDVDAKALADAPDVKEKDRAGIPSKDVLSALGSALCTIVSMPSASGGWRGAAMLLRKEAFAGRLASISPFDVEPSARPAAAAALARAAALPSLAAEAKDILTNLATGSRRKSDATAAIATGIDEESDISGLGLLTLPPRENPDVPLPPIVTAALIVQWISAQCDWVPSPAFTARTKAPQRVANPRSSDASVASAVSSVTATTATSGTSSTEPVTTALPRMTAEMSEAAALARVFERNLLAQRKAARAKEQQQKQTPAQPDAPRPSVPATGSGKPARRGSNGQPDISAETTSTPPSSKPAGLKRGSMVAPPETVKSADEAPASAAAAAPAVPAPTATGIAEIDSSFAGTVDTSASAADTTRTDTDADSESPSSPDRRRSSSNAANASTTSMGTVAGPFPSASALDLAEAAGLGTRRRSSLGTAADALGLHSLLLDISERQVRL